MEDRIKAVVEEAVTQDQGAPEVYVFQLGERRGVEVMFTAKDPELSAAEGRAVAFNIHRALWTSSLPIGSLTVWALTPNNPAPKVNAQAGHGLMQEFPWDQYEPTSWAEYLIDHHNTGNSSEESYWYNERP